MLYRTTCFLLVLGSLGLAACAGEETGSGGADTTTSAGTTSTTTAAQSSSGVTATATTGTGGCAQDCSQIQTPVCYEATCNAMTGQCELAPEANGTACEDGLYCTVDDTCTDGECKAGDPLVCVGSDEECQLLTCDEAADTCTATPVMNGSPCTPADVCTTNAICQNGTCLGAPKDCSGTPLPNECTFAQCDPNQNGDCVVLPGFDGLACTIGDPCEANKVCSAGVCSGTPIPMCALCSEMEDNGSIAMANADPSCSGWQAQIGVVGDQDFFAVDVTVAGSYIRAQTTDVTGTGCPGWDSEIYLYDANMVELANNDQSPVNSPCSLIGLNTPGATNLPAGTYYVRVEDWLDNGTSPPYMLLLNVYPPGCGDSIIQTGEECDDGNQIDGDGCSALCELFTCALGEVQIEVPASAGLPAGITDLMTTTSTLTVAQTGTISKLALVMNITHTYTGDLEISLTPPGAASLALATDVGGGGDNFSNTVFSSDSSNPIIGAVAPFSGVYAPQGGFGSVLGTQADGVWTLAIFDDAGGDTGTLDSWKVVACVQP